MTSQQPLATDSQPTPTFRKGYRGDTGPDFYATPAWSFDHLAAFRKAPRLAQCMVHPPEHDWSVVIPSDAVVLEWALRNMVWGLSFENEFVVCPNITPDMNSETQAQWDELTNSLGQRWAIPACDYDNLEAMRDAFNFCPTQDDVLDLEAPGSDCMESQYWVDATTALPQKSRPLYRCNTYVAELLIVEDAGIEAMRKLCRHRALPIWAAFMLEGDHAAHGVQHDNVIFIAQECQPPYLLGYYTLNPVMVEYGRKALAELRQAVQQCRLREVEGDEGPWPGVNNGNIVEL